MLLRNLLYGSLISAGLVCAAGSWLVHPGGLNTVRPVVHQRQVGHLLEKKADVSRGFPFRQDKQLGPHLPFAAIALYCEAVLLQAVARLVKPGRAAQERPPRRPNQQPARSSPVLPS